MKVENNFFSSSSSVGTNGFQMMGAVVGDQEVFGLARIKHPDATLIWPCCLSVLQLEMNYIY